MAFNFEKMNKEPKSEDMPVPELSEQQRAALRAEIRKIGDRKLDAVTALKTSIEKGHSTEISDRLAIKLAEVAEEYERMRKREAGVEEKEK
ncbi:MAG: hypothetical protein KGI60_03780 [Patescibacteria group bacterium]|nr:hypothetical protein [Patescibacteria group bacterium]